MMKGCDAMTDVSTSTVLAQLVAPSRKPGADRSNCSWGGGNTSAKANAVWPNICDDKQGFAKYL
jgi:rhamnose utilization protein RhaD (predicted bifunctional aldolase and dehydrogenase)